MRRGPLLRTLGAGLAAGPAALAALERRSAARAQGLTPLRLGLAEGDDATPSLYAAHAGLFRKYGLDVQITPMPSGAAGTAALAGGSLDVAGTSLIPFFSAFLRGVPLRLVAPLALYSPASLYAVLLVKKDAPYRTGRDLNGKTIASPALRDLNWLATMAWIDRNGGDSSTVKAVEMPPSVVPAALADGRIDASTITTPRYVQQMKQGGVRSLGASYAAIAPRFAFAAMAANVEYAQKNPDVIARFGRAIRDASAYTNTHHAQTVALYASFAKLDPADIADAPRAISEEYLDAADIQPLIDMAVRYKILDHTIDPRTLISPAALKP